MHQIQFQRSPDPLAVWSWGKEGKGRERRKRGKEEGERGGEEVEGEDGRGKREEDWKRVRGRGEFAVRS